MRVAPPAPWERKFNGARGRGAVTGSGRVRVAPVYFIALPIISGVSALRAAAFFSIPFRCAFTSVKSDPERR